jgi:hypothetical protein
MTIIRYVDIYKTEYTQDGPVDVISVKDVTLPIIVDPSDIINIQPYFNGKGKIFKNVSYIKFSNETMKVVGNYKLLDEKIKNYKPERLIIKGFKSYGK